MDGVNILATISEAQELRDEYREKLKKIENFLEEGELFGEIWETFLHEHETESKDSYSMRDLTTTLEEINTKRYHMVNVDFDRYDFIRLNKDTVEYYWYLRRKNVPVNIINELAQPACYGDNEKQETRIDETVRKGRDITSDKFHVCDDILDTLRKAFCVQFRVCDVKITPYKINLYDPGDFFNVHRDHPEPKLLGTILLHVSGDQKSFYVEDELWDAEKYNVCMFYNDVPHQVKATSESRITISFKVYSVAKSQIPSESCSVLAKKLANRIPSSCGIVLQNMYPYDDNDYKGADLEIYHALKELGKNTITVPVIVREIDMIGDGDCFRDNDKQFSIDGTDLEDIKQNEMEKVEECYIKVFLLKGYPLSKPRVPVYFLGKGQKVGEMYRNSVFTGNNYDGALIENVYISKMFYVW